MTWAFKRGLCKKNSMSVYCFIDGQIKFLKNVIIQKLGKQISEAFTGRLYGLRPTI